MIRQGSYGSRAELPIFMKNKDKISKLVPLAKDKLLLIILIISFIQTGLFSTKAMAEVNATFLYTLSDFNGPLPYNWVSISVDRERNEIYVVDPKERDVTVFNEAGMEIYRFGDDGSLGSVQDAVVEKDGRILVLSRRVSGNSITLCNFRGEPLGELELKKFPADFSGFSPNRLSENSIWFRATGTSSARIGSSESNAEGWVAKRFSQVVSPTTIWLSVPMIDPKNALRDAASSSAGNWRAAA